MAATAPEYRNIVVLVPRRTQPVEGAKLLGSEPPVIVSSRVLAAIAAEPLTSVAVPRAVLSARVIEPLAVPVTVAAAMFGVATTTVTADADHAAPRSAVRRVMPLSFERD